MTAYPHAPWRLRGQLWVSLFRVSGDAGHAAGRPHGLYGAAFVSYEPGSDLTYSELLVARPVARARFTDVSRAALRLPFRAGLRQPGLCGGVGRTAPLWGSARPLPCRARWEFAADGPLGWLAGRRPVGSFRLADFRLSFG